jgi:hypothetical protein
MQLNIGDLLWFPPGKMTLVKDMGIGIGSGATSPRRGASATLSMEDSPTGAHVGGPSGAAKNGRPGKPSTLPWAPAWRWTGAFGTLPLQLRFYTPRPQEL